MGAVWAVVGVLAAGVAMTLLMMAFVVVLGVFVVCLPFIAILKWKEVW